MDPEFIENIWVAVFVAIALVVLALHINFRCK
jgi:hypothetical protein